LWVRTHDCHSGGGHAGVPGPDGSGAGRHLRLRDRFFHSIALACLVGIFVTLQADVFPFTLMEIHQ
jgi:hypothetical protein